MPEKPNILVIWGDDIGITNLSCYSSGLMGYRTPNIDRIADEGMRFTDSYGEQSCTAGRASFITGQSGFRTGLTKVGVPGSTLGLRPEDPTIAELLKSHGYTTGQFGKNHLGDRNEFLPTAHGFDEFYGNLYHLNAEEEPELPDYPNEQEYPHFRDRYGPRGVLHCWATDTDDDDRGPALGPGRQAAHRGHRPADEEADGDLRRRLRRPGEGLHPAGAGGRHAVLLLGEHHPHASFTHTKPESLGQAGPWQSPYHDTMIDHDQQRRRAAGPARRAGPRRRHVRDVQHRQRPAHEQLAGRRDDAVPQREEHQLGGCVPGPDGGPLARPDRGRRRVQRGGAATTTGCRPSCRWPASRTSWRS